MPDLNDRELAEVIVTFLRETGHLSCIGFTHDPWTDTIVCSCGETWTLNRIANGTVTGGSDG